ncbi:outer membrane lipoprotein blc [Klebsiella pneumoniae]|uniref:Outer membrane lipoprotein blc n=1 Tax=Klebsiella pneumoniae TaxID=573 RepID=A0A377TPN2_KLEPN|nr:outer membrane lipoprotein blc [Klebsiella pneumoniae]
MKAMACCHWRRYRVDPRGLQIAHPAEGAYSRLAGLTPVVISENGMRSLAWRIASSEAWEQVTATYGARSDGGISVVNRGYDPVKKRWNESDGKAYFTGAPTTAALKVSFFGPFYGGYNVIRLDDDYQYALVSGPNRDYLWILSRTPTIPAAVKQDYLNTARELGFDVDRLVWIRQTPR